MLATMQNANAYQLQSGNSAEMLSGNDRVHGAGDLRAHGLGKRPSFLSRRGKPAAGTDTTSVPAEGWRDSCRESRTTAERVRPIATPRARRRAGELPAAVWAALAISRGLAPAGQEPTVVHVPRDLAG
ncbi:MAG: hypothetical protein ACE5KM_23990 [Planctomycetaceae bacterium]